MLQTLPLEIDSVRAQQRAGRRTSLASYVAVVGVGLLVGLAGVGALADPFSLALALLICGGAAILVRPIAGVYLIVFFSVLGDGATMFGYPFNLNFSSHESMLFIANALTFTPAEVFLGLTVVSWLARVAGGRDWRLKGRPLLWPLVALGVMVVVGLAYGVLVRGGDRTVAIWEARPLLYVVAMYILASNLLTRSAHYVSLAWVAVLAVAVQSLWALHYFLRLSETKRDLLSGLTDHTSSLLYVWVFLLALALCLLRGCSPWARFLVVLAVIPSAVVFVLSQRRAAAVGFAAGLAVLAFVLFFRRRKAFFVFVPIVLIFGTAYTAAYWNAVGGAGFGARAVKAVIAPNSVSKRDASSDVYRVLENYDLVYTIRVAPMTGTGFGHPFLRPAKLPDISFFPFYQYIPHNSILWVWLQTGYVGFAAMLFAIAAALRAGTRSVLQLPSGDALAVTVGALCFVLMFFVFAFVDIAWDARSCIFLALCVATSVNMQRLSRLEALRIPATAVTPVTRA